MKKFFLSNANNGNVRMEADTISKNGHSSKSQNSRGNFFSIIIVLFSMIMFSMIACSSPEKEGKRIGKETAKKHCECNHKYPQEYEILRNYTPSIIRNEKYDQCIEKAFESKNKAEKKYATNRQKLSEFEHAYWVTYNENFSYATCERKQVRIN